MAFKNLLVVLSSGVESGTTYAIAAAAALGARIKATFLAVDPGVSSYVIPEMSAELFESARARARAEAEAALQTFEAEAHKQGLKVQAVVVQGLMHETAEALARMGHYSDLIIVMQPNPDVNHYEHEAALEKLLFEAGRPLLLVPYLQQKTFALDTVLVAWDESATASRAMTAAMPLLDRARRIEVVTVEGAARASHESCHMLADGLQGPCPL